jgi:thermitase
VIRNTTFMRCARQLLVLSVLSLCAMGSAQGYVRGEVLVKIRGNASPDRALNRVRGFVMQRLSRVAVARIHLPDDVSVPMALIRLRSLPEVEYVEPNYLVHTTDVNDPLYPSQWALNKIKAPYAWNRTHGSPQVLVAVLDSGVDLTHPELVGKIAGTQNFVGTGPVDDVFGHGTHTAGTIAANTDNGLGVASLGYETRILVGKVVDDNGQGNLATVAMGIEWAANNGAKVVSMSLAGISFSSTLKDVVDDAWSRGIVLVAAAGNYGNNAYTYPAAYDKCIAVAATDESDRRCSFSTYGSWVHVAAPGNRILSLNNHGGTALMSGTSMATPHVAALAALLWANGVQSNNSIRFILLSSGDPTTGFGPYPTPRINARKALLRAP